MEHKKNTVIFIIAIFLSFLLLNCSRIVITGKSENIYSSWPQYGGNPSHTNYTSQKLSLPLELIWDKGASTEIGPTLITLSDRIIYGTLDGRIEVRDVMTGKNAGKIKTKKDSEATCAYSQDMLVVVRRLGQSTISVIRLDNGKTIWHADAGVILSEPLINANNVYVTTLAGKLLKYDLSSGAKYWEFEADAQLHSSPAFAKDLIIFGSDNGYIYAINDADGTLKWKVSVESAVMASPMISSGIVYIGSTDSKFYALQLSDGQELWHFQTDGKLYNCASMVNGHVLFGSTDHILYCVEAESGNLVWKFDAAGVIGTDPVIANDVVFFGTLEKVLFAVDVTSGKEVWSFELEGRIRTSPCIAKDLLFIASEDDLLYCFAPAKE